MESKYVLHNGSIKRRTENNSLSSLFCPFSEGMSKRTTSQGSEIDSVITNKAECGEWCALFEYKKSMHGALTYPDKVVLHCSSRVFELKS